MPLLQPYFTLTPHERLQGKTALVSGAASGIGRASAILFASEGANVVALDRAPAVEETAAAIRKAGGQALALVKDSSEEANVVARDRHGGARVRCARRVLRERGRERRTSAAA